MQAAQAVQKSVQIMRALLYRGPGSGALEHKPRSVLQDARERSLKLILRNASHSKQP
jgi:hypothetical protein